MKRRSEEILRLILQNTEDIKLSKIAKKFSLSEKTIKNDLDEINSYLSSIGQNYLFFDSDGSIYAYKKINKKIISDNLTTFNIKYYKFSQKERLDMIFILLLWNNDYYNSMKTFAEILNVSRVTIINDIEKLRKKINPSIKISTVPGKGVFIDVDRYTKTNELLEKFIDVSLMREKYIYNDYLQSKLNIKSNFNEVLKYVNSYFSKNNIVVDENSLFILILYIFIVVNTKCYNGKTTEIINEENQELLISYVSKELGVRINNDDAEDYRRFIKAKKIDSIKKEFDELNLYSVINHFLISIDQKTGYDLSSDSVLIESLIMHITNMRDWGNLEIKLEDIEKSVVNFEYLHKIISEKICIIENYLMYKLSSNMTKSIIIHICISLMRNNYQQYDIEVLIVCPGSVATGRLLEFQIQKYFNFKIKDVIPIEKIIIDTKILREVDFVISTVDLYSITSNFVKVSPILEMADLNNIQSIALKNQSYKHKLVQKYQYNNDRNSIYNPNVLSEILIKEVQIIENKLEWKRAIFEAAEPLLEKKYISKSYVLKSIENVEKYGDYIILGYGLAIAHAGKKKDVYKDSLSLLISRKGIEFFERNKKVYLLFFFATKGEEDYKKLYELLIRMGQDRKFIDTIAVKSSEEAYEMLINY
ncbi:HTH domain protein [Anaerococcus lactolyticus ATCC 51172]|uniref:HTH domain protein n=1 Tax=Anaerococcus lactolyticus ATCC 51172 TaxID=525254 RepID=C2BGE3_9FIRM|nr:HTH domain-containing protein [Anaerococcus lactolyticus]EEI86070.1 HTH domain protein [Anaerococcus lactolyticus ATCC 51172]